VTKQSTILTYVASAIAAAAVLAGCGGAGAYGGGSGGGYRPPVPNPSPSPTQSSSVPLQTASLKGSPGFVNGQSFTVYVFDADLGAPGQSTCNGACAQNWPPVVAPAGTLPANWTAIGRQDGSMQLAYKGRPLYTFAGDGQPLQTNGDGINAFGGYWHIARP
jgi:predicted lipoprotein with Yx(FWY)xxD motif